MKNLLVIPFIVFFNIVFASQDLMSNFAIYELSEVIHSARYDYEGGRSFKLMPSYDVLRLESESLFSSKDSCSPVSAESLIQEMSKVAQIHLINFDEDREVIEDGMMALKEVLSSLELRKCVDSHGRSYVSSHGQFLYSLNHL